MTKVSLIAVLLILSTPALAADKPDLSTPEKAARAFFDALKSGDAEAVKRTVAPERVTRLAAQFDDWRKIWAAYKLASIDGAEEVKASGPNPQSAVRVNLLRPNGSTMKGQIRFSKIADEWRMDEN
ncbi:MAG TPA: hypothetical protein VEA69_02370 [Tepidisphaeraceae bacterium]|nr:hypothetical protein [Tepidisphaeraceae bacterium]